MCTVSMVAQDWSDRNRWRIEPFFMEPQKPFDPSVFAQLLQANGPVTRKEFDDLKKELQAVKELLIAAKKYDAATGQPDCESDEKTALFKRLAEVCGIDLSEVFSSK